MLDKALHWLLAQDRPTTKRLNELLERCDPSPLPEAWARWWPTSRKLAGRARAHRDHEDESRERKQRLSAVRKKLLAQGEQRPGELSVRAWMQALRSLATGLADGHTSICRVLARLEGPELA